MEKLWKAYSKTAVESFLGELSISNSSQPPKGEDYIWKPVGGSISNAANIHTTEVSIAPIIERITNSFDAAIEVKEFEFNKGKQMETALPASPRKAIEQWWQVKGGDTATYSEKLSVADRTKFASSIAEVSLKDSNIENQPTVVIRDSGIGQTPEDFIATLLRLGRSNKITRSHLHGTYGHGGSSSFRFCDYSIILSRRNPVDSKKNVDKIAWTIVRKNNLQQENLKLYDWDEKKVIEIKQPPIYEYLCHKDGKIPFVSGSEFPDFVGTYVAHIEYQAKEWQNLSRGLGYRLFRNYLFDPVLPFRLVDGRDKAEPFERNMFGARSTLEHSEDVAYRNESEETLEGGGKLVFRYWLLYNPKEPSRRPLTNYVERENSRNTIIVTLNGQRHGTLEKSIVSKRCRLPRVADTLLIQVIVDGLNKGMIGELCTSARSQLVQEGSVADLVQDKLIECLTEDLDLAKWETKLSELHAADDESTKEVKRLLDRLIDIGVDLGTGGAEIQRVPQGVGKKTEFNPCDPPTLLRLMIKEDPIEIIKGETRRITLELNAPNKIFRRRKNKGRIWVSSDSDDIVAVIATNQFKDGRLPADISTKQEAEEYVPRKLKFLFEAANLSIPLETERSFVVVPTPKYEPIDPPTELKFLRGNPVELQKGKSNLVSAAFNGSNDILTRPNNPAFLDLSFDYPQVSLVRRIGPHNGKIQFTLKVSDAAKTGDNFTLRAQLRLFDGSILSDERICKIIPEKEKNPKKGDYAETSRPRYDVKRVKKNDWSVFDWTEEDIGEYELKKDDENKDRLYLYVNLDSKPLEDERQRRIRQSQTQNLVERIENKYVAHIAYHLFQQFDEERKEGVYEASVPSTEELMNIQEVTEPEQYEAELKRVARTLILSFRGIADQNED